MNPPLAVGVARGADHRAGRDGSGVHERGRGMLLFEQQRHDRVEGQPRGVGADPVEDLLRSVLVHGENRRGDLRHRFDAEDVVRVADRHDVAVGQTGRDAEERRRYAGQVGDVVGVLAALLLLAAVVGGFDGRPDRLFVDFLNHDGKVLRMSDVIRLRSIFARILPLPRVSPLYLPRFRSVPNGRGRSRRRPAGRATKACAGRRSRRGRPRPPDSR